jgi:hypothetical protein
MATVLGYPVNFAFDTISGITSTTGISLAGKMLLQSADVSKVSKNEEVFSGTGELASESYWDQRLRANLEYIPTGSSLADAVTNTTIPAPGTIVNITACASLPLLVAIWHVKGEPKISKSNTGAAKVTLPLEYSASITVAAT